jgi:hypothetical protein
MERLNELHTAAACVDVAGLEIVPLVEDHWEAPQFSMVAMNMTRLK